MPDPSSSPDVQGPDHTPSGRPPLTALLAAAASGALFIDAAVETFAAGAAVRWWMVGAAVLYAGVTAVTWRRHIGWQGRLAIGVLGLLGVIAATAWGPGGLADGVRLFGQPTTRVLALLAAAGVGLAGVALVRVPALPMAARVAAGAIATYGAGAFLAGAIANTPVSALLAGQSLWQALPRVLQGAFLGAFVVLPIGLVWTIVRAGLRRPAETSWRAEVWRVAALAASLAIVLAGLPMRSSSGAAATAGATGASPPQNLAALVGVDPNAPPLSPEALNVALTNSLRAVADGDREMSRDRWDPGYVASHLGSNPDRIFQWVQRRTFWIPYLGMLRGPVGVLMDRLGNSLDRSVLLATLLRQSGRTVRLAHGTLPPDLTTTTFMARYIERLRVGRGNAVAESDPTAQIAADYQLDEAALRRTFEAQAAARTRQRAALEERLADQTARLSAAVGTPRDSRTPDAFERALGAAADHWWVQILDSGTWRDLDLDGGPTGTALAVPDRTLDPAGVPNDLRHQVTVRVITEQWASGALTERVALQHVLRPADIIGMPVALHFAPAKWPQPFPPANMDPAQGLRQMALDQHEWSMALMVGRSAVAQAGIRDTGDAAAASGPAIGGAFSRFGDALDKALETPPGVAPKAPPAPSTILTSTWIEYEIQAPGNPSQKIRRVVFDLVGPSARAARPVAKPSIDDGAMLTRSLSLMMDTEILPMVSRFVPQFVTHLGAQSLVANRDLLLTVARGDVTDDFAQAQNLSQRLAPMPTPLYGLALARFAWSRHPLSIYIDQPNILTRHTFFAPGDKTVKLLVATDIVANPIGVDPSAADPFAIRLEQGVLDTNAEALLASDRPSPSNAGWAFTTSGGWTTLTSPGDPKLASLRLPDDARRRIASDLAAGYVVVAPGAPVAVGAGTFTGWWRVDPATGQTLGMGSSGWGQEMVEYLIVAAEGIGLAFLFAYLWCRMAGAGASPDVAGGCTPAPRERHPFLDIFITPVHARLSQCMKDALFAALLTALLMPFAAPGASGGGKGSGRGGSEPPGDTQPGLGKDPATDPYGDTLPGDPFGDTLPGGGPGGKPGGPPGEPAPGPGQPGSGKPGGAPGAEPTDPKFQEAVDKFNAADKKFWDLLKGGGSPSEIEAARAEMNGAAKDLAVEGASPENKDLAEAGSWDLWNNWHWYAEGAKAPASPGSPVGPGGGAGVSPNAPTLPGTGPGGTQIIPPGPTAPTQPGICPGPGCPPSPYAKTQTGMGGVLNALGQKGGG
jgi:hypothetical protein